MTIAIPTRSELGKAADMIDIALSRLVTVADAASLQEWTRGERAWNEATGLLQDAAEVLGYDFRPMPAPQTQPPADDVAAPPGKHNIAPIVHDGSYIYRDGGF